ncbi:hypothetical protein E2P81_ATG06642 [Venturia nashicola]|uniref:Uncharacterized protein n=1 Tax=Venturia nashicola TaxID=86259 RepID=A0A4Z1NXI0_9PEZI|nr:hypothetical protein E6O75_ATG06813 [Venturia nashicola]TLD29989.1 hypothetical protein E2P81_ATG06642 [Venturia nashicola]
MMPAAHPHDPHDPESKPAGQNGPLRLTFPSQPRGIINCSIHAYSSTPRLDITTRHHDSPSRLGITTRHRESTP